MYQKPDDAAADSLEQQIGAWRAHLRRSGAITGPDAAELEDHLREQIASLSADGLARTRRSWWRSSGWAPSMP